MSDASPTPPLSKEDSDLRASLGFVKDYMQNNPSVIPEQAPNPSKEQLDSFLEVYKKDAIVSGACDTVAEEAVRNGFYIVGSKSAKEKALKKLSELNFLEVCEIHVRTQHVYGNSFIELKAGDDGSAVGEIHNLETSEMFVLYDEHGEIVGYEQSLWDVEPLIGKVSQKKVIQKWTPDEVLFVPLKRMGSDVHSFFPLEPAVRAITARLYAHYFLQSVFQNFKPQTIIALADNNISPAQVESLANAFRAADKDPSKKILSIGELDVKTTGMYEFNKDIVDILNYFRQEILTVTKVPGIYVGITSDSNRGVGEFEANAFQGHLLKIQRQLERVGNEILKRSNINATVKFKPPSIKSQTDIIDQAKKLRDMGYGDEVITPFLFNNGIDVPVDAEFEQENQISMDDYESRQGSGKGVTEGKIKLDETGRSDAGKAKQEQNDAQVRASESKPSIMERLRTWRI